MNAVFLDTGYLLALELSNDQNHQAARRDQFSPTVGHDIVCF
jgi:predicted nucleic acid-binding protein